jgi:hypothetical protein
MLESEQADRSIWCAMQRDLVVKALDNFWFCLASLGHPPFLISTPTSDSDKSRLARVALPKLLLWWDVFCDIGDRFHSQLEGPLIWTYWGGKALSLCRSLGMRDHDLGLICKLDSRAAGRRMAEWFGGLADESHHGR